ncbi:Ig-like domain-containing protein [Parahaliea aestuarii]|uniref:BapA prefix-like domain-containing protein n=1 Tax=Parahaliea aestuarii TaxID=1852021 RepID=A0A5C8ZNN8_9GAMM|nr:Ig-like domain-containing protein [Parahaliea aestuarii]TXS89177.1 BapA prefix-like domain-containing protein [Parahaliea aestuarii]
MSVSIKIAPHGELAELGTVVDSSVPAALVQPSDVSLDVSPDEVLAVSRSGNALVIELISGEQVVINDFFSAEGRSHLYFQDDEFAGAVFLADLPADPPEGALALNAQQVADTKEDDDDGGAGLFAGGTGIALGALALAGIAAAAGGGGGGGSNSGTDGGTGVGEGRSGDGDGGTGSGGADDTAPDAPVVAPTNGTVVSGSAESGSTVTLVAEGEVIGETQADADGNWQVDVEPDLEHGVVVSVTATDDAGNVSDPTEVEVDALAPQVSLDDLLTNDATPALSGQVDDPESVVEVTVNGASYAAINNGDGTWTLPDNTLPALEDGSYDIVVTATDQAGNQSEDTGSLVVDTVPPDAPSIDATNGTVVTGSAEPGTTVLLSFDGESSAEVPVNSAGNWSFDPSPDLADGTEITAVAVDAAGNQSPPDTEVVDISLVDTTPPPPPVLEATDGTVVSGSAEAGSMVTLTVDGQQVGQVMADAVGAWTVDLEPDLEDGDVIVGVATDAAGNVSEPASTVVDSTGPLVTVDDLSTTDTTPALSGTVDEADAEVLVTVDGTTYSATNNGDGSWTLADNTLPPLSEGANTIGVTAVDAQGNTSFASGTVTVDSVAPVVALSDFSTADATPPLNGTVDDPTAAVTVRVGGVSYNATNNGDGTWSLADNTLAALADGDNTVTVTATDAAGNSGSGSAVVTIDASAVSVMLNNLQTNDATPPLQGSIDSPDASIVVTVAGVDYSAINNGDGTWSLPDNTLAALPEGVTEVTVTAENTVGTTDTATANVTVDTVAPVVSLADFETQDSTPGLAGSVDDPGASVVVTIDGLDYAARNNGDGTWSLADDAIAALVEGDTQVTVTATDIVGNAGSDTATVTLDTITDAVVTVDGIGTTSDSTPLLSGTSSNVAGPIVVEIDGETVNVAPGADGSWSTEWPIALAEGDYTVTATGVDADGLPASDSDDFDIGAVLPTAGGLILHTPPLDNTVETVLSLAGIDLTITGLADALDNGLLAPLGLGGLIEQLLEGTTLTGSLPGASQMQVFVVQDDFLTSATDIVVNVSADGSFTIPLNDFLEVLDGVVDTLSNVGVELALRGVDSSGEVSDTAFVHLGNAANLLENPLQALGDELGALLGEDTAVPVDRTEFIASDQDPSALSDSEVTIFAAEEAAGRALDDGGVLVDEEALAMAGAGMSPDGDSNAAEPDLRELASIDLSGNGNNTLTLDLDAIARFAGADGSLRLEGDAGDRIELDIDLGASLSGVAIYEDYVALQFATGSSLLIEDDLAVDVA